MLEMPPPLPAISRIDTSIADWSEEVMRLPPTSGRPGRLVWEPWQRGILEAYQDPLVKQVTIMAGSQLGKSLVMLAVASWQMANDPCSMMMIHPTQETASRFLTEKIAPLLHSSPELDMIVERNERGGLSQARIDFVGGNLWIASTGNDAKLRSVSARVVLADEVDAWRPSQDASNPVDAARARSYAFPDSKLLALSTPQSMEESRILREFEDGSRAEFWIPCPHCEEWTDLTWESYARGMLHTRCCGAELTDAERWAGLLDGEWRHEVDSVEHKSFHASWLQSQQWTVAQVAAERDPEAPRGFVQNVLGMPYDATELENLTVDDLEGIFVDEDPDVKQVLAWTVGVDVQADRVEYSIVCWSGLAGLEAHVAAHRVIPFDQRGKKVGTPEWYQGMTHVWSQFGKRLMAFHRRHKIDAIFVDSQPTRFEAEAFIRHTCQPLLKRGILRLVHGESPSFNKKSVILNPSAKGILNLAVDDLKLSLYEKLQGGGVTVRADRVEDRTEYMEQLMSERLTLTQVGQREERRWVQTRKRNEALDCLVYAYAARHHAGYNPSRRYRATAPSLARVGL